MNLDQIVKIGMADLNVSRDSSSVLRTTGLGSCVGVSLYDPSTKVAGMAHVMLPSSEIAGKGPVNVAKYADTAIPDLIGKMKALGARQARLVAKMAGGAQMFAFGGGDALRIGPRNVESCKEWLEHFSIPVIAEDTGGNFGRTIELYSATGILLIRSVQHGAKEL